MTQTVRTILIVGAGASYGARDGCERPPCGPALAGYLLRWWDVHAHSEATFGDDGTRPSSNLFEDVLFNTNLRRWLVSAIRDGFEPAMRRLVDERDQPGHEWVDFSKINRIVAQALLTGPPNAFSAGSDRYDTLLRKLGFPEQPLSVISFNYDILIEEASARLQGVNSIVDAVHYPELRGSGSTHGPLRVYKPHGSVNWLRVNNHTSFGYGREPDPPRGALEPSLFEGKLIGSDTGEEYVPDGDRESLVLHLHDETSCPILALYALGKPSPENAAGIDAVRVGCVRAIAQDPGAWITVLGLRPPTDPNDDPALQAIFDAAKSHPGPKKYYSVSAEDCEAARSCGFEASVHSFEELVQKGAP
jgi:hypothetical protein